jgi:acetylglutamate kinase
VVAVLRGVINTQLVAQIGALGGRAISLCGADGMSICAERYNQDLGFVGRVTGVDRELLLALLDVGAIPVVAPIGIETSGQLLNINADTVAGEVARALAAEKLIFLTDVDGLLDAEGCLLPAIDAARAADLRMAGTISGGMIPKADACFRAVEIGVVAHIANGHNPGILQRVATGESVGTRIGG